MARFYYVNGRRLEVDEHELAGHALLALSGKPLPAPGELPYLFCGNGSCRDCNVACEGLDDVPSCRFPLVEGMSLRTGDGAGAENALARQLADRIEEARPLETEVLVVGAGSAGRAALEAAAALGVRAAGVEARNVDLDGFLAPAPAFVTERQLSVFDSGRRRRAIARAIVLASGANDRFRSFPGSALPGVYPMDLMERYVELGALPGENVLLAGSGERAESLREDLLARGAARVVVSEGRIVYASGRVRVERAVVVETEERAVPREWSIDVDAVAVAGGGQPALSIAQALGGKLRYDRRRRCDVPELDDKSMSTIPGFFIAGDAAGRGQDAARDGERVGESACRWVSSGSRYSEIR